MSLSRRSVGATAKCARASSPLCLKVATKPSCVNTSHNSSQVTASSSTTRIWGGLRGTGVHLLITGAGERFRHRQGEREDGAGRTGDQFNMSVVFRDDVARDDQSQAAAGLFRREHRFKQM